MVLGFSSVAEFVVAHPPPRPATAAKLKLGHDMKGAIRVENVKV